MKKFRYEVIEKIGDFEYVCGVMRDYSLLMLLKKLGTDGWELVGEVEGKLIVKKEY